MNQCIPRYTRRSFLGKSARGLAAGIAASGWYSSQAEAALTSARRVSANDRVRLAVIGTGGMGRRHVEALSENPQCELVALCDVAMGRYMPVVEWLEKEANIKPDTYQDFRKVLDRNDVDAILVATPDHWHPLIAIMGCQAGKDVYVEKPACPTVAEGRAMVNAARRYGRVVQLGTQQRNMEIFQRAMKIIHSGRIGQVTTALAWVGVNVWEVGETLEEIPKGLDWDMWLGPAPYAPFSKQRFGGWMGWHDYARGGQLTNWGVHLLDIVHWGIQQDRPLSVQALGGSYRANVGQDNYDNIEAVFEYPGCIVTWEQRLNDVRENKGYGIAFYGEEGALHVDRNTITVKPDEVGILEYTGEPEKSWAHPPHHNDFFECIRSRQRPAADIEQGLRSTTAPLLAGIALKTRRKLYWDGDKEQFINDPEADRYLSRAYRAPWHI
jgi:predicted dehydrogenase